MKKLDWEAVWNSAIEKVNHKYGTSFVTRNALLSFFYIHKNKSIKQVSEILNINYEVVRKALKAEKIFIRPRGYNIKTHAKWKRSVRNS